MGNRSTALIDAGHDTTTAAIESCPLIGDSCLDRMLIPEIETEHLLLRRFTSLDLEPLFLIYSDPAVMTYMQGGLPVSREETEYHLANLIKNYWERRRFGRWVLVNRTSGEFVGYAGLRVLQQTTELIYVLGSSWWGKGLATEAARACLRYGFEELKLDQIVAVTHPDNRASQRVLEKIGMRFEKRDRLFETDLLRYTISLADNEPDDSAYTLRFTGP